MSAQELVVEPHSRSTRGSSAAISQEPLCNQDNAAVQFNFPNVSGQFDVIQKTVTMDVCEDGKTGARPVTVTTIVNQ
jgi:hypothetical protein